MGRPALSNGIPFCRPHVAPAQAAYLTEAIESGSLAGDGRFGRRAEALLEDVVGAPVLLTGSCTSALEMAALLLDIGPGDEVIVPGYTFVSTANAFELRGATIVFADCDPATLSVSSDAVASLISPRTRAVVAVHYAGVPSDLGALAGLCAEHGVALVEDAAHALFGTWDGRPLGSFGGLATFSFHQTKNITCGEGGALVVADVELLERARVIREKGTNRHAFFRGEVDKYSWIDIGSSYLMSELQGAVLTAQLEFSDVSQMRRKALWNRYYSALTAMAEVTGTRLPAVPDEVDHPAHLFWMVLPDRVDRARVIDELVGRGIGVTSHYHALHRSPYWSRRHRMTNALPVAEHAAEHVMRLPLFVDLTDDDQERVVDAVLDEMRRW